MDPDPDPGRPKTCRSYGSGSESTTPLVGLHRAILTPVAVVVELGPLVAAVRALRLWRRGGRGRGRRLCPAGARILADGRHGGGALHHLPVADVLAAMHVGAQPGPIVGRMVQIWAYGGMVANPCCGTRVENLSPAMGRGIDSRNQVWNCVAKLHRLAGRNDNPMPT